MNDPRKAAVAGQDAIEQALPTIAEGDIGMEKLEPGFSRELTRLLILLAAAAVVFILLYFTPLGAVVKDIHKLRAFLKGDDLWAELTYVACVTALMAVGVPRLMFYGLGGLVFGFWEGLILAQLGSLGGSFVMFQAVRSGGRGWLMKRFGKHRLMRKACGSFSSVKAVVLIRQLPLSNIVINSALAVSQVRPGVFLVGSFIGFLPQGVIATLIGSGVVDEKAMSGLGQLLAAGVVLLVGALFIRHWRRKNRGLQVSP